MGFNTAGEALEFSENYEDGWYMGTVVNVNDPLNLNRVQADVPGLYDSSIGEVPWIAPDRDSPFGFGVSAKGPYGVYGTPPVGSTIKVMLQNGDEHKPMYRQQMTKAEINSMFTVGSWGYQDPSGLYMIVDPSGNKTELVPGNYTIVVKGNVDIQVTGTATYTAASHQFNGPINTNSTIHAAGTITTDQDINAAGNITDFYNSANPQSMASMRNTYNIHYHVYDDNGTLADTQHPTPQIP